MTGMTIPQVPYMPAGHVATLADMTGLAACCTFLLTKPLARVHDATGGVAIGASANVPATLISFATTDIDTDTMTTGTGSATNRLIVRTPGWYKVRYGINIGTGAKTTNTAVYSTTGASNPLGAGVVTGPFLPSYSLSIASIGGCAAGRGIWPFYMYASDYLQVKAGSDATGNTTATTDVGSYFSLEFAST